MEAFDNSFNDFALLTYLVQDTINIIYNESLEIIKEKIINILKAINLIDSNKNFSNLNNDNQFKTIINDEKVEPILKGKKSKDKMNNITNIKYSGNIDNENLDYEKFLCKFRPIFQEYFSVLFQSNYENFSDKIRNKLNLIIKEDVIYNEFSQEKLNFIEEDVNSKYFNEFSLSALKLCLYMHLHEPKLIFNLPSCFKENKNIKRKLIFHYYKKDEFINIEGFPKEKSCCVLILPSPLLRSNYSYQGIKPAVYIVTEPTKEIINECELSYKEKEKLKEKEFEKEIDEIKIEASENNKIVKDKKILYEKENIKSDESDNLKIKDVKTYEQTSYELENKITDQIEENKKKDFEKEKGAIIGKYWFIIFK